MKNDKINILGYVEGFYGRLLNWDDRIRILSKLNDCNLKTYFYCPKEDNFHRFSWKENYPDNWRSQFKKFCNRANEYNIKTLVGIAPGLDFDFSNNVYFDKTSREKNLRLSFLRMEK